MVKGDTLVGALMMVETKHGRAINKQDKMRIDNARLQPCNKVRMKAKLSKNLK